MKNKDISLFLKKADELRALFVLGQRVIPFLEEIFVFVSEIQPLFEEINSSIKDNLKKMPNASKQLSKVTEATELATNEIMDIVDGLMYKSDLISGNIKKIYNAREELIKKPLELLTMIAKGIEEDADLKSVLPEIKASIKKIKEVDDTEIIKLVDETNKIIQSVSMDSSSIMMSLQVQDITSQQLAAVNNLLTTVQGKLNKILQHFQESDVSEVTDLIKSSDTSDKDSGSNVSKMHRDIAFDPDAVDSISLKESRQSQVDEYIKESSSEDTNDEASQDDIDAMFNASDSNDSDGDAKDEESSQDDIDAMFNASDANDSDGDAKDEESSQDDIDAMFNAKTAEDSSDENDSTNSAQENEESISQQENEDSENNTDSDIDIDEEFSQDDIDALFGK